VSDRRSILAFAAVTAACVLATGAYVAWAALRPAAGAAGASASQLARITSGPFVVFLTWTSGLNPHYELAVASLANPERRLLVGQRCDRVAMTGDVGICVRHSASLTATFRTHYFDRSFARTGSGIGSGIPSRARVSPSGRLATVTSFRSGHSYDSSGAFSTQAVIYKARSGKPVTTLEALHVFRDGKKFEPENRNFWGVTFVDDRQFYATMGTGKQTYLVRGDLARRVLTTVHENVECPSLAPDGKRVAFKHRGRDGLWRFAVLELATGKMTLLAERRSIDDQLAWADDDNLLYGGPGGVWTVPADGSGAPRLLLPDAVSPTVVR
jgi:hypothetical protein